MPSKALPIQKKFQKHAHSYPGIGFKVSVINKRDHNFDGVAVSLCYPYVDGRNDGRQHRKTEFDVLSYTECISDLTVEERTLIHDLVKSVKDDLPNYDNIYVKSTENFEFLYYFVKKK